jgi:hypothetical protein
MQFRLHYRGPLKANGDRGDKHILRKHFHKQLKKLWDQVPLKGSHGFLKMPTGAPNDTSVVRQSGGFNFAPLVCQRLRLVPELRILLLRDEPPGQIVTQSGDIDNRLKTLFDSLKVPELNALPPGAKPDADEDPFFCLLEDDNLIVSVAVETDRLLEPNVPKKEVELIAHVTTRQLEVLWETVGLA